MKIVLCTYSKNEKYADLCVRILDELWEGHPEIVLFSDRGEFAYPRRVIGSSHAWTPMVIECLHKAIEIGAIGADEPIVLILEDHVPHQAVDGERILQLAEYMKANANTYLNLGGYGKGQLLKDMGACRIHRFEIYQFSSLHPAIWSIAHLRATLDAALRSGAESPWQFETVRIPNTVHYTTGEVIWHSPHGGFLWEGLVSRSALATMRSGALRSLRRRLVSRFVLELPRRVRKRIGNRTFRLR
jgi:hypothetical protein